MSDQLTENVGGRRGLPAHPRTADGIAGVDGTVADNVA